MKALLVLCLVGFFMWMKISHFYCSFDFLLFQVGNIFLLQLNVLNCI